MGCADYTSLTNQFIAYMPGVSKYQARLTSLGDAWDQIKRLAEVNCPEEAKTILPSMEATQRGFDELQEKLIPTLVREELRKVTLEITSKAQVAVDILIRNLFERTADVGFLATDADIVSFVLDPAPAPEAIRAVTARLEEYRDKYTVYDEIVVLGADGTVRAHLDEKSPIQASLDPLVGETMQAEGYVETFRPSDLRPRQDTAHIFSHRIAHPGTGEAAGVLCLCFRFENEMQGVFKNLRREGDKSAMLLLDRAGRVIASSDANHVRLGTEMEMVLDEDFRIVEFGGREYLAKTCPTKGYQGYMGLGWYGHVMVPCDAAFRQIGTQALDRIDPDILGAVMGHAQTFSGELADIAGRAAAINLSLRRVVWNGQVMSKEEGSRLKSVLRQISKTGGETNNVFADSIANLNETVISSSLDDTLFLARLAVDIMDRNLYERANDCRWWALASAFRRILAQPEITAADRQEAGTILEYINSLYTVYTRLFVYDREGTVIAASNLHRDGLDLVGRRLDGDFLRRVLELENTQQYAVSPFEPSPFYGGRPTYVYSAAIRHPVKADRIVGGIGILFDAEPQFSAMLTDSLPPKDNVFAMFTDRKGRILSSTDPDCPVGEVLSLPREFFALPNGRGMSNIVAHNGYYHAIGCMTSQGYREYKTQDEYHNDVVAFVFLRLGRADTGSARARPRSLALESTSGQVRGPKREFATFLVGDRRYGLDASLVEESVGIERLTDRMPGAKVHVEGVVNFRNAPVAVLNLRALFGLPPQDHDRNTQIIVVRTGEGRIGLLVDDLDDVPEVEAERVSDVPAFIDGDAGFTGHIVVPAQGEQAAEMLLVLDPERILSAVKKARAQPKTVSAGVPGPRRIRASA